MARAFVPVTIAGGSSEFRTVSMAASRLFTRSRPDSPLLCSQSKGVSAMHSSGLPTTVSALLKLGAFDMGGGAWTTVRGRCGGKLLLVGSEDE